MWVCAGKKKKVEHLWKLEGATERLKLVQADLMEENSFDNAIMGCKGVFHIASPVLNHISDDPKVCYLHEKYGNQSHHLSLTW